jgi:hypothetical protein
MATAPLFSISTDGTLRADELAYDPIDHIRHGCSPQKFNPASRSLLSGLYSWCSPTYGTGFLFGGAAGEHAYI